MKTKNLFFSVCILFSFLTSCVKDEFDKPPIAEPKAPYKPNTTIKNLKNLFNPSNSNIINDTIVIEGIVISSDEYGNIYKSLYIQDTTGGIVILLDRTNLYTHYKIGQKVVVYCKGLALGEYGGMIQLGYKTNNNNFDKIPNSVIDNHLFKDGFPLSPPTPKKIKLNSLSQDYICTYVQIDSIRFQNPNQLFASQDYSYTNHNLLDSNGNIIVLRISKYASFANNKTPAGIGSIKGILTIYSNTYQIIINNENDLFNWNENYNFETKIYSEDFNTSQGDFITFSVKSNKNWEWSSQFKCMAINGYNGDEPSDDWLISPSINLIGYTNANFTFRTWTKYYDYNNNEPLSVWISTDYIPGDNPYNYTWQKIEVNLPQQNSQSWTSSGKIDISNYSNKIIYIAFKYTSSGTTSNYATTWEVDNFEVYAK